jgi:hypothetical protein
MAARDSLLRFTPSEIRSDLREEPGWCESAQTPLSQRIAAGFGPRPKDPPLVVAVSVAPCIDQPGPRVEKGPREGFPTWAGLESSQRPWD